MTLRELCKTIRPAQKIRIKKTASDPGMLLLRYGALDIFGLVDPILDQALLDWNVAFISTDSLNDDTILIRIKYVANYCDSCDNVDCGDCHTYDGVPENYKKGAHEK